MNKRWRKVQDRQGSARRRRLEFDVVMDQVRRRKDAFEQRLQRNLETRGECLCYRGTRDHKGYARLNLSYKPDERPARIVTVHAHRLFLILKLRRPIRRGFEAGHTDECAHRTCVMHVAEEHYSSNAATAG